MNVRLHLLLRAGETGLALPADRVRRVGHAAAGPPFDLAAILGLTPDPSGEEVVVEVGGLPGPLLADRVVGIVDTSGATFVSLPNGTRLTRPLLTRALILGDEVYFELDPDELANKERPTARAAAKPGPGGQEEPQQGALHGQALLFRVAGRSYCAPFGLVQSVLHRPRVFDVPLAPPAHVGVLVHRKALLPVFDLPSLLEARAKAGGEYVLLLEAGGELVGISANELRGVVTSLAAPEAAQASRSRGGSWLVGPGQEGIFLPAYDRLFAPGTGAAG